MTTPTRSGGTSLLILPSAQIRAVAAANLPKSPAEVNRDLRHARHPSELGVGKTVWMPVDADDDTGAVIYWPGVVVAQEGHTVDVGYFYGEKLHVAQTVGDLTVRVRRQRP